MTTTTTNYNLKLYDSNPSGDGLLSFLSFRESIAGTDAGSNMNLIDAALQGIQDGLNALENAKPVVSSAGTRTAPGPTTTYQATSPEFLGEAGSVIIFTPDNPNLGTTTLRLIGTDVDITASMVKYDTSGVIVNLSANDLITNHPYIYTYDGTRFVWVNGSWDAQMQASVKAYYDSLATTMTNKRITQRVYSTTYEASPTIDSDSYDMYVATVATGDVTFGVPSGTPTSGQRLLVRVTASGGDRTISFSTSSNGFRAIGITLTTVVPSTKTAYFGFVWNATASKWDCPAAKALET